MGHFWGANVISGWKIHKNVSFGTNLGQLEPFDTSLEAGKCLKPALMCPSWQSHMVSWVCEGFLGAGWPQGVRKCKKMGFRGNFTHFQWVWPLKSAHEIFCSWPRAKVEPDLNSPHKNALVTRFWGKWVEVGQYFWENRGNVKSCAYVVFLWSKMGVPSTPTTRHFPEGYDPQIWLKQRFLKWGTWWV